MAARRPDRKPFAKSPRRALARVALAAAAGLAGCVTSVDGRRHRDANEGPWLEPTPQLALRIDEQVQRLPYTHGEGRIEQIHWFATVGEPAYPQLLELVADPRPDVAGTALAALGATRDSRLIEHLRAVALPEKIPATLRYEWARTYLRLGDWSEAPVLIRGLAEEELMVRALCGQALFEATGQRFGFQPKAEPAEREAAIARWEAWWAARQDEGVLVSSTH